jgi:hypothetical protein
MDVPRTLPERLFLLACDLERERLTARFDLGMALRAAALSDLLLDGRVEDAGGSPAVTRKPPPDDPFLLAAYERIAAVGPRSWQRWIRRAEPGTVRTVRDRLEETRQIRVEPRGLLPARITVRDRRAAKRHLALVQTGLRRPPSRLNPRDEAVLALALAARLRTVATVFDRRRHAERVRPLVAEPIPRALRRAIRARHNS